MPGARRFIVDGLTDWGKGELADVAELVVSELAGNAALHSDARFMYVTVETRDSGGVRVGVEDDGTVGTEAVVPHALTNGDDLDDWAEQATTGRGLAIVSMLAADWGVATTPRGKRVWADVVDPDEVHEVRQPTRADAAGVPGAAVELPPGWVLVRLADCPVELSLRADLQLDELVRELQLASADRANSQSRLIAEQISDLLTSPAHARLTGRRTAEQALVEGRDHVDVDMAMPREFSELVRRLHEAVKRADELCEQDQLLAIASTPEMRALREWMTHEIIAQAERGETPVPWPEWTRRVTATAERGHRA